MTLKETVKSVSPNWWGGFNDALLADLGEDKTALNMLAGIRQVIHGSIYLSPKYLELFATLARWCRSRGLITSEDINVMVWGKRVMGVSHLKLISV